MRTTIEITDEQRARLMEIAAGRGEKGFSSLVREAIELFLAKEAHRGETIEAALALKGTFTDEETESLSRASRVLRETWR